MCRATPNYNINFMAKQTKKTAKREISIEISYEPFLSLFALERRRFLSNLTYFRAGIIINELNIFQLSPERGGRFCNNALSWGAVGSRLTWNFHQPRLDAVFLNWFEQTGKWRWFWSANLLSYINQTCQEVGVDLINLRSTTRSMFELHGWIRLYQINVSAFHLTLNKKFRLWRGRGRGRSF